MGRKARLAWSGSQWAMAEYEEACRAAASKKASRTKPTKGKSRPKSRKRSYESYIKSAEWRAKRQEAIKHYGGKCTICGSRGSLRVEHRHFDTVYHESVTDLEVLCVGCFENKHEGKVHRVADPMTREFMDRMKR